MLRSLADALGGRNTDDHRAIRRISCLIYPGGASAKRRKGLIASRQDSLAFTR
jgi:hypothetical protein